MLKDRGKEDKVTGYYMSKIEFNDDNPADAYYQPAAERIAEPGDSVVFMTIPTGLDGHPTVDSIICQITSKNLKKFDDAVDVNGLTRCDPVPDMPLDGMGKTLATDSATKFLNKVERHFGTSQKTQVQAKLTNNSWREVVNHVGKLAHSDFDVRWFEDMAG